MLRARSSAKPPWRNHRMCQLEQEQQQKRPPPPLHRCMIPITELIPESSPQRRRRRHGTGTRPRESIANYACYAPGLFVNNVRNWQRWQYDTWTTLHFMHNVRWFLFVLNKKFKNKKPKIKTGIILSGILIGVCSKLFKGEKSNYTQITCEQLLGLEKIRIYSLDFNQDSVDLLPQIDVKGNF